MDCQIDYKTLKEQIISQGNFNTEPGYDGLKFIFQNFNNNNNNNNNNRNTLQTSFPYL